jgi:hypothetical protein
VLVAHDLRISPSYLNALSACPAISHVLYSYIPCHLSRVLLVHPLPSLTCSTRTSFAISHVFYSYIPCHLSRVLLVHPLPSLTCSTRTRTSFAISHVFYSYIPCHRSLVFACCILCNRSLHLPTVARSCPNDMLTAIAHCAYTFPAIAHYTHLLSRAAARMT